MFRALSYSGKGAIFLANQALKPYCHHTACFGSDSTHGKDGHILTIVDGQILTIRPTDGQNLTILFGRPGHFLQAGKRDDLFLWSMIIKCLNLPIGTKVPVM